MSEDKKTEDMTWEEERLMLLKSHPFSLRRAESCTHFLCGMCCESLNAGRTWNCLYLRVHSKDKNPECGRYKEVEYKGRKK